MNLITNMVEDHFLLVSTYLIWDSVLVACNVAFVLDEAFYQEMAFEFVDFEYVSFLVKHFQPTYGCFFIICSKFLPTFSYFQLDRSSFIAIMDCFYSLTLCDHTKHFIDFLSSIPLLLIVYTSHVCCSVHVNTTFIANYCLVEAHTFAGFSTFGTCVPAWA